jgi:ketosteroid isomerase-like protein
MKRFKLIWTLGLALSVSAQTASSLAPCSGAEHRQFDFWLGHWDVYETNGSTKVADVRVEKVLDGCALLEVYEDASGLRGQSLSTFDRPRSVWHQAWITNRAQWLHLEGNLQGGEMVLEGKEKGPSGNEKLVRGKWMPIQGGVREVAETSPDNGKTWERWFDLTFRSHSQATSSTDDSKTVAELDTRYQAAVKTNEFSTMDHILADDFVLVTGTGKRYSKTDLLDEARSGRILYEHQEELEQHVHVWNDTAVVNAKLWVKGTNDGKQFDYKLWFTDTYIRTAAGWKYVFGQASRPLDAEP